MEKARKKYNILMKRKQPPERQCVDDLLTYVLEGYGINE
jgi:hypothetical protein